jgi:hypothetical protein
LSTILSRGPRLQLCVTTESFSTRSASRCDIHVQYRHISRTALKVLRCPFIKTPARP